MPTRRHKVMLLLEKNPGVTALELTALAREKECNVRSYLMWASYAVAVKTVQSSGRKRYTVTPGWLDKLKKHEANPRVRAGDETELPPSERTTKPNPARLQSARAKELLDLAAAVNPGVKTAWVVAKPKRPKKVKPHHIHLANYGGHGGQVAGMTA